MRRVISTILILALAAFVSPVPVAMAAGAQDGNVAGTALDASKNPLPNHTVRLRKLDASKQPTSTTLQTTSAANGSFGFSGVTEGEYIIEVLDASGNIIGTSSSLTVAAGATATVTVTASALGALAAAGTSSTLAAFLASPLGVAVGALTVAGTVIGIKAAVSDSSPSR